jgi:hypothetical protein
LDRTLGSKGVTMFFGARVEEPQLQPVAEIMKLKQIKIIY